MEPNPQALQKRPSRASSRLFNALTHGDLTCALDTHMPGKLAL